METMEADVAASDRPHVDLRSDFLAPPSAAMLEAYCRASKRAFSYGLRDDPDQAGLEHELATLFGKEDALIFPSCTMSNLAAIMAQTQPGDTVLCPERAHIFGNEGAGAAAYAGVQLQLVSGLDVELPIEAWVAAATASQGAAKSRVSMCCLENTHNRLGGRVLSIEYCERWAAALQQAPGMSLHLDGSRILYAAAVLGCAPIRLAAPFGTIAISLNKGLGSPAVSALMGSRELIQRALRIRQRLGGGIRPTGAASAAARVALAERSMLSHDVHRAKAFASRLAHARDLGLEVEPVQSNLVFMRLHAGATSEQIARGCEAVGLRLSTPAPDRLRAAFHRGVDDVGAERAAEALYLVLRAGLARN